MLKNIIILLVKFVFLFYTLLILGYYCFGLYYSYEYDLFILDQIWIGAIMMVLIFINVKFIQWEIRKWKARQ